MEHIHGSYVSENRFQINPSSREIINESKNEIIITQFDRNSERFIFTLPKVVDEHDMTLCSAIRIHYINTGGTGKTIKDVYEVSDIEVCEDNTTVTFSWLLSENTTSISGALSFAIQFICTTGDNVDYNWSTLPYKAIKVLETYNNAEDIVLEEYSDILKKWKEDLFAQFDNVLFKSVDLTKCAIVTEGEAEVTENVINSLNSSLVRGTIDISGYCELEVDAVGADSIYLTINDVRYEAQYEKPGAWEAIPIVFKGVITKPIEVMVERGVSARFTKFITTSDYVLQNKVGNINKALEAILAIQEELIGGDAV